MTLQQLNYTLTIAKAGSMNRAAEQIFVSQPTLTSAIHELEDELGFAIFHRTSRGVSLTNEGTEFLQYARQVCQQYELLAQKYLGAHESKRKFAVSTQHYSFVVRAFVDMVKQFDTSRFQFTLRETRTLDVIQDVGEKRSELGILYRSKSNRRLLARLFKENHLEFQPLVECHPSVYLWKGHPLAGEPFLTRRQLEPYPCLSFEQGDDSSACLSEEILSDEEHPRAIHATDRGTVLNLMVGLNGYILCAGIICEELNGADFLMVPFVNEAEPQPALLEIGYIKRRDLTLDAVGDAFLWAIRKYLNAPDALDGPPA